MQGGSSPSYLTNSNGEIINAGSNAGLGYKAENQSKLIQAFGIILDLTSLSLPIADVPGGQPLL